MRVDLYLKWKLRQIVKLIGVQKTIAVVYEIQTEENLNLGKRRKK